MFILTSNIAFSKAKDVNIYLELLGSSPLFKPTIEYNINTFELFDETQITYITLGASMAGIINGGLFYSSPIIGINQVIGDEFGFEFGACYFRQYKTGTNVITINSMDDLEKYDAIGFNTGFREYTGSTIFRINYTPLYRFDTKEFKSSFSISWGWGF